MNICKKICISLVLLFALININYANNIFDKKQKNKKSNTLTEKQALEFDYAFIEGEQSNLLGDYNKALSWYAKCLKIDPSSAVVYYQLANIYLSQKDINAALELSRKAVALQKKNSWYQLQLAKIYQMKSMHDQACKVYDVLIGLYPEKLEYYYMEAALFASVEKRKEAIDVYNRLEKQIGISESVSLEKYNLYNALGNKKMAYSEVKKLIKKNPYQSRFYGMLADMYLKDSRTEDAYEMYMKILEVDPDNGLVQFYLADYYRGKKDLDKSEISIMNAFKSYKVNVDQKIQYLLGVLMNNDKLSYPESVYISFLDVLVKQHSGNVRLHALYADFLNKKGDSKQAIFHLREVLKQEKTNYTVWEELLLLDNKLLDFDNMFKDSNLALKQYPKKELLYLFNGVAAVQLKKYDEALSIFQEGLKLCNSNIALRIQFMTNIGDLYYEIGDSKKSFLAYDEVLSFDSDNVVVLNNYSYFLSEEKNCSKENLIRAKAMSAKCINIEQNNSTYLDTYAWILFKLADYKEAKIHVEKALMNGGLKSGVIIEHYGDILFRLGEKEKALQEWKKAKKQGEASDKIDDKIKNGLITE